MTGINHFDFYEHESRQGLVRIVDDISSTTRYVGITHKAGALETEAVWCIYRERLVSAGIVRTDYASDNNKFDKQWTARASYFGAAPSVFTNTLSVAFDGVNDHVVTPNVTAYDAAMNVPFSVSLWAKPNVITGITALVSNFSPGSVGKILLLDGGSADMYLLTGAAGIGLRTSVCFIGGTWTHFVWTYDGSATPAGLKGYANGVNLATSTLQNNYAGASIQTGGVQYFGAQNTATGRYYSGKLDEISFWNKALSAAEVAELYATTKPADLTQHTAFGNLTNWWRVDGSTFSALTDVVGGITGTCTNMLASAYQSDVP